MPTVLDVTCTLLHEMAHLSKDIGRQNPHILDQMTENSRLYIGLVGQLRLDPAGDFEGTPSLEAAVAMLRAAADFLESFGSQTPVIGVALVENAAVYRRAADALAADPYLELEDS